jgi:hypothetical protein
VKVCNRFKIRPFILKIPHLHDRIVKLNNDGFRKRETLSCSPPKGEFEGMLRRESIFFGVMLQGEYIVYSETIQSGKCL